MGKPHSGARPADSPPGYSGAFRIAARIRGFPHSLTIESTKWIPGTKVCLTRAYLRIEISRQLAYGRRSSRRYTNDQGRWLSVGLSSGIQIHCSFLGGAHLRVGTVMWP